MQFSGQDCVKQQKKKSFPSGRHPSSHINVSPAGLNNRKFFPLFLRVRFFLNLPNAVIESQLPFVGATVVTRSWLRHSTSFFLKSPSGATEPHPRHPIALDVSSSCDGSRFLPPRPAGKPQGSQQSAERTLMGVHSEIISRCHFFGFQQVTFTPVSFQEA